MGVRGTIFGVFLGTAAAGAAVGTGVWQSIESDSAYTERIADNADRSQMPDSLERVLSGPKRSSLQKFSEVAARPFYDAEKDHAEFLAMRKSYAMKFAFENRRINQYRQLVEEIAEGDDGMLFMDFLNLVGKTGDYSFNGIIERRLTENRLYFYTEYGVNRNRELSVNLKSNITTRALELVGKTNPRSGVREAAKRIAQGVDNKPAYLLAISRIGGNHAIEYFMQHFDEGGLRYSEYLEGAVRNPEQADRAYRFIWDKIDGWTGQCKEIEYAFGDIKDLSKKFGTQEPPSFRCEYRRALP